MSRSFDLLKTFWIWPMLNELHLDRPWILSLFLRLVVFRQQSACRSRISYLSCPPPSPTPEHAGRKPRLRHPACGRILSWRGMWEHSCRRTVHKVCCPPDRYVLTLVELYVFSRHILSNNVPIEHTVLCRVLELVASSYIMASTFNRTTLFHGVTLPRSWILENMQKLNRAKDQGTDPHVLWEMMIQLRDLLEHIYSGNDSGRSRTRTCKHPPATEPD